MKLLKKIALIVIAAITAIGCFSLAACSSEDKEEKWAKSLRTDYSEVKSDSLYVKKVENLPKNYIMGMDASSVPSLEDAGVKFYDYDGSEKDVYKTLSENGVNAIRIRVWNDPKDENGRGYGGGNNDINRAVKIGKRATDAGMGVIIDFHYSDFWADPAKQYVPKAWTDGNGKSKSVYEIEPLLKEYTKTSLTKLKNAGVNVVMVQVGNETNGFMCGYRNWDAIVTLMAAGSSAIREVFPDALVAVHFANPENVNRYKDYSKKLDDRGLDYDVFGSSYYPYWHGTLDNLKAQLDYVTETYGKKTMVMETSYAFTTEDYDFSPNSISEAVGNAPEPFTVQGQANQIRNVVQTTADMKNCIGVCYWEGTMIGVGYSSAVINKDKWNEYGCGWTSEYAKGYQPKDVTAAGGSAVDNQTFFDRYGKPLESLKVFALLRYGNTVEDTVDAAENASLDVNFKGKPEEFPLPTKAKVVLKSGKREDMPVVWTNWKKEDDKDWNDFTDANKADVIKSWYEGREGKYELKGLASGQDTVLYVSMIDKNFLQNYSFEEDGGSDEDPKHWTVRKNVTFEDTEELFVQDKQGDAKNGTKAFHFWREKGNTVNFDIEQEVTASDFVAGKYKYSVAIMGGGGTTSNIYAYVKINGEEKATSEKVYLTGWGKDKWAVARIDEITVAAGDKVVVGMHVEVKGDSTTGAWGTVDEALLNALD